MKLARNTTFNPALMGVIPFVNVVFLLLVFYTLSTRFAFQPGIAVTLPDSPFMLNPQHDPQIVSIVSGPVPAVYFRDQKLGLDEFARTLAETHVKYRTLIVKADRATPYDLVASVMKAGLQQGYSIVLATRETRP